MDDGLFPALLKSFQLRQPLAVECRVTKGELVPLGALEPEVHVVLPGEADAAVHLYGPVGRARVYVRESGLGKGSGAGSLARARVEGVGAYHTRARAGSISLAISAAMCFKA